MRLSSERREGILILHLGGRLDAQGAIELQDYIGEHMQETDRAVVFDMAGVPYLSSAGIRTLMMSEKLLKSRNGGLQIAALQSYPLSVLEMTGFVTILSLHSTIDAAFRAARALHSPEEGKRKAVRFSIGGAEYGLIPTGAGMTALDVTGYPPEGPGSCPDGMEAFRVTVPLETCSLGWGAPGGQAAEDIMGELLTIGTIAAYLPSGETDTPDYLVVEPLQAGIPLAAAFLVSPPGPAGYIARVRAGEDISLADLFEALGGIIRKLEPASKGILFLSFCAESPEVSVRDSKGNGPLGKATLAGCAIVIDPLVHPGQIPGMAADVLVRHLPGQAGTPPRVLSLVFPDLPFREEKPIAGIASEGLSSGKPVSLRYLAPGTRIRRATVQVSVISEILHHTGTEILIDRQIGGWNPDYERIVHLIHYDCSEVRLIPISGGYSGSLVFRDDAYDRRGRREMPFVLKLDRYDTILAEIRGYEGHVKRYIQNNATQIIQHERSGDFGGILYTFVGIQGAQSRIFSLEDYYRSHATEEVLGVFDTLFRKVLRSWYGQPRFRDLPLYRIYGAIYNYDGVKQWAESSYGISAQEKSIELPWGMGRSANPLHFIERILPERLSRECGVYEGSVHGDLNLRNVLMDDDKNLWLIDFAMTCHSHILRDIAKLESVLKFEMIPIESDERLLELLDLEKVFLSQERLEEIPDILPNINGPDVLKAFSVVRQLRKYADTITLLDDDIRQYWLALLNTTLCVPAYASVNDRMREYAWVSASFLCDALERE